MLSSCTSRPYFSKSSRTRTPNASGVPPIGSCADCTRFACSASASDMAKPQFSEPSAPNYTTIEASNGARLEYWVDRLNVRPWVNTLLIRVGRGFLRAGDTLTVRFGDGRQGSPGLRLQTNCEERFELKVYVDAFATYEFTELPLSPSFALAPGPAVRWKAILPSLVAAGEPFRLAIVAEDLWGN